MVEKTVRMNLLFDFYGSLLTKRQREFFHLYYGEDLSLGEIANAYQISRQAVYDIIKRGSKSLEVFEASLGFIKEHKQLQKRVCMAEKELDNILASHNCGTKTELCSIKAAVKKLLAELVNGQE